MTHPEAVEFENYLATVPLYLHYLQHISPSNYSAKIDKEKMQAQKKIHKVGFHFLSWLSK